MRFEGRRHLFGWLNNVEMGWSGLEIVYIIPNWLTENGIYQWIVHSRGGINEECCLIFGDIKKKKFVECDELKKRAQDWALVADILCS